LDATCSPDDLSGQITTIRNPGTSRSETETQAPQSFRIVKDNRIGRSRILRQPGAVVRWPYS
jgi:hypothetical protein